MTLRKKLGPQRVKGLIIMCDLWPSSYSWLWTASPRFDLTCCLTGSFPLLPLRDQPFPDRTWLLPYICSIPVLVARLVLQLVSPFLINWSRDVTNNRLVLSNFHQDQVTGVNHKTCLPLIVLVKLFLVHVCICTHCLDMWSMKRMDSCYCDQNQRSSQLLPDLKEAVHSAESGV